LNKVFYGLDKTAKIRQQGPSGISVSPKLFPYSALHAVEVFFSFSKLKGFRPFCDHTKQ
jgi:hypothetical protein